MAIVKKDDDIKTEDSTRITQDNITSAQLVQLVWHSLGSPCGTVQNWLDHSTDVAEVW